MGIALIAAGLTMNPTESELLMFRKSFIDIEQMLLFLMAINKRENYLFVFLKSITIPLY